MDAPPETCEACGGVVAPDEVHHAELTVDDLMCPTPMTFHERCYEAAKDLWEPGSEAICSYDPEFPETQGWPTGRPQER